MNNSNNEKPMLLKAIELILADTKDIHNEAQMLLDKFRGAHHTKSDTEVKTLTPPQVINNVDNLWTK